MVNGFIIIIISAGGGAAGLRLAHVFRAVQISHSKNSCECVIYYYTRNETYINDRRGCSGSAEESLKSLGDWWMTRIYIYTYYIIYIRI